MATRGQNKSTKTTVKRWTFNKDMYEEIIDALKVHGKDIATAHQNIQRIDGTLTQFNDEIKAVKESQQETNNLLAEINQKLDKPSQTNDPMVELARQKIEADKEAFKSQRSERLFNTIMSSPKVA